MANQVQPIFILPEGTQRTTGRSAQKNNIMAAIQVADAIRTTLGPKGMDKMIVDSLGDITITNDGVTILQEMQVEHPAAKMLVEVAKTQEEEIGDGTTTAVIVAGELLKNAQNLLDQEVHPTVLARGYLAATEKAKHILSELAKDVTPDDREVLIKIAETAITGKGAEAAKEVLSRIAVRAALRVLEPSKEGRHTFDRDSIRIEKKVGGSVADSELIDGLVLEKEAVHASMPKLVTKPKIALLDCPIEIRDTEIDAKIQITDPGQMQAFLDQEEQMLRKMVERIVASGANVVFCQKGIDDVAQYFLAKQKILAVRRVKKSDMEALARATGGTMVTNLEELTASDLGTAGTIEQQKYADDSLIFVKECPNPKTLTVLVRGGTEHIVAEVKRAMSDAIGDIQTALTAGKIVAGAASIEMELSRQLNHYAQTLSGREQLAVQAFSDSLTVIAKTLAENAGLDPIDVITELKAAHESGKTWAGIDVFSGKVVDAWEAGVIEPLRTKIQAITSASEVAQMILRIDDVILGAQRDSSSAPPGGQMQSPF